MRLFALGLALGAIVGSLAQTGGEVLAQIIYSRTISH